MKKILLLIFIVGTISISFGQKGSREKVKAFKIAYLSEQLDLSSEEAQKFWPIYNDHDKIVNQVKREGHKSLKRVRESGGINKLNEEDANELIRDYLNAEEKKNQSRINMIKNLKNAISNKKILKLIVAEKDFNKRLLRHLRDRKKKQ
ncbi:sensor of ECF-type sigma factor [Aquimarina sp. RZ0]|uniref:sensor of ECF-type sigma factor n=1 Tax=Aquimarina sp. RZ0 TaxID=2607730 RepID=UPI0011F12637|nr:sensor of ECF-type sigma factor [Aquimarina sp. RZ0]KAA1242653.1 sensor of ECF-type sigma factor [Aquimarina sp. RZ0]